MLLSSPHARGPDRGGGAGSRARLRGDVVDDVAAHRVRFADVPEDKIDSQRTNHRVIAFGCGRTDVLSAEPEDRWSSLRARAAFEMSCDTSAVEITLISDSVYGATGCDKKIVYKETSGGIRVDSNQ